MVVAAAADDAGAPAGDVAGACAEEGDAEDAATVGAGAAADAGAADVDCACEIGCAGDEANAAGAEASDEPCACEIGCADDEADAEDVAGVDAGPAPVGEGEVEACGACAGDAAGASPDARTDGSSIGAAQTPEYAESTGAVAHEPVASMSSWAEGGDVGSSVAGE